MQIKLNKNQNKLLKLHREIDLYVRNTSLAFISGWSTAHPVRYELLYSDDSLKTFADFNKSYNFMDDDSLLKEKVRSFHERIEGNVSDETEIFTGAGSSPLISSLMVLLSQMRVRELFYVSPIYHVYYYLAQTLGIRMKNCGENVPEISEEFLIQKLPDRKIVLLITDPSWVFGKSLSKEFWLAVKNWQIRTGSIVIVDGTFQYTKWQKMTREFSSLLIPEQTFRLVCPTKSLCIHGVRFAYLILPKKHFEPLGYAYCKLVAATSIYDIRIAHLLIDQLCSEENNRKLTSFIAERYNQITESGLLSEAVVTPDSTYYVFGKFNLDLAKVVFMNNKYFELNFPDEFIRVNILSPDLSNFIGD